MTPTRRALQCAPFLVNLATASFHSLLPRSSGGRGGDGLVKSLSKILFLRHGTTKSKPREGHDRDCKLDGLGRKQALLAGKTFGAKLAPFYSEALVSPVSRTLETAELFMCSSGATNVKLKHVPALYDGTMQPGGSELFQELGYAPLQQYLNHTEASFRITAQAILGQYAQSVVEAVHDCARGAASSPSQDQTLCVVGHAIYLPAAALGVASLVGCNDLKVILSTNTREAEGYLIDIVNKTVSYERRDE